MSDDGRRLAAGEITAARGEERPASCPDAIATGYLRISRTQTETESDLEDSALFHQPALQEPTGARPEGLGLARLAGQYCNPKLEQHVLGSFT